jgi:hypothetical protein
MFLISMARLSSKCAEERCQPLLCLFREVVLTYPWIATCVYFASLLPEGRSREKLIQQIFEQQHSTS